MHASEVTPEAVDRANELYWKSDRSVNQIAEELDLSKGALYGVLHHEGSGLGCPLCGDEVGYPNRTARDRGSLECPTCAWDGSADETMSYAVEASGRPVDADARRPVGLAADPHAGAEELRGVDPPLPAPMAAPRMSTIAGGALLGAAVGLALVMWARRR
jgi:predicted RNA-binding Zn-ribbon protein involved in translation (DUF1610 family)